MSRENGERKVVALGEKQRRDLVGRQAVDGASDRLRIQPRRIDDEGRGEPHRLRPASFDRNAVAMGPPRDDRRRERDHRPIRLRIALERQHEGVTIDNAGRGRKQRAVRPERRFECAGLRAAEQKEIVDAVRLRLCLEPRKLGDLALVGGDDQLAASPVRHAVLAAEAV